MSSTLKDQDLTGRNRLAYNVLVGWLGQLIFVISGFILPRMIDTNLGKDTLGIWDFSWSLITYFDFIYGGLLSSVNRYVAKYRSVNKIDEINIAVNSVLFVFFFFSLIIALLSSTSFIWLPFCMKSQLSSQVSDASWVIFYLGIGLAIKVCLSVFGGILTGSHRWDLQHGINTINRLVTLVGMATVLLLNGGLAALALVYVFLETLVLCSRCPIVFRICPGLKINPRLAQRAMVKTMWRFGLKTLLPDLANMLSNQAFSLFLIWHLGPAALANYSRPRALVNNIQTFVQRFSLTLTPTASSLKMIANEKEIEAFVIKSAQLGAYIVYPLIAVLVIMGGHILNVWMGQEYANNILAAILGIGFLPILIQLPLNNILQGFNSHGRPGLFKFIASMIGSGSAFFSLNFLHFTTPYAVIMLILPFWISEFFATPLYASKKYKFSLLEYWLEGIIFPLRVITPMIVCLLIFRILCANHQFLAIFVGVPLSLLCYALSYWFFVATKDFQNKVTCHVKSTSISFLKYLSK